MVVVAVAVSVVVVVVVVLVVVRGYLRNCILGSKRPLQYLKSRSFVDARIDLQNEFGNDLNMIKLSIKLSSHERSIVSQMLHFAIKNRFSRNSSRERPCDLQIDIQIDLEIDLQIDTSVQP